MFELVADHPHLGWMLVWSVITFAVYAYDKHAATKGKDRRGYSKAARVPELALHGLALIGGFVGGWIGRHGLRHKTRKPMFAVVLSLATVAHGTKLFGLW